MPPVWANPTRVVLVAAIVSELVSAPGQTVGVSVFVDYLIADLDISRSQLATAYLIGTATGALSMPFAGRPLDRRGLRWATTAFGAAFAAVFVAMAGMTGLVTLTIGFALTRMLGQGRTAARAVLRIGQFVGTNCVRRAVMSAATASSESPLASAATISCMAAASSESLICTEIIPTA